MFHFFALNLLALLSIVLRLTRMRNSAESRARAEVQG